MCEITDNEVMCTNCTHNSVGNNCEECKAGFYHSAGNSRNVCVECNCYKPGAISTTCNSLGECNCRTGQGWSLEESILRGLLVLKCWNWLKMQLIFNF